MALEGQHVLGFSPDGKLFAFIGDQGILRIWDTETNELKQEYTPNLHLAGPCTAFTWLSTATQGKQTKKQRKSTSSLETLYLALGTSTGQVSLYSYAKGQIERNLKGEGHAGKITSMAQDAGGNLYTCGEDCLVVVWSLPEEKQLTSWNIGPEKPYSIVYMPHSHYLVIGARIIKVYSVATQELVQSFTGHAGEVNLMCSFVVNESVEYAVTTSRTERVICLWKIGSKGRNKSATCTLLMEDIAHCITCSVNAEGTLRVAGVTRSGVIHMYYVSVESIKAEKPVKPKVTIEIASESGKVIDKIPAVAASLQHSKRSREILFGYGDRHFMIFEYLAPNITEKINILSREHPKNLLSGKFTKKTIGKEASKMKTLLPIVKAEDVAYKSLLTMPPKKIKAVDKPIESRIESLNLTSDSVAVQAQKKVHLLVQALHSKDADLLRSVLWGAYDLKTIQLTLQKLPIQYVGSLVNELTHLMQQKRINVEFSLKWLKVLAETHSSQLLALGKDDLLNKFGPCIGIIEHRANCLKEISRLNGRLNLMVTQIKRNTEADNLKIEDALIYEDKDASSSDLEFSDSKKEESDDEWEEGAEENDVQDVKEKHDGYLDEDMELKT